MWLIQRQALLYRCIAPVFLLFLFLCIALLLLAPIHSNQVIPTANNYFGLNDNGNHIVSIVQAKMALSQGQFPLRTSPLEHYGWGYPVFQFYSTTSYTIAGWIYKWITPSNPFMAYKLTIILALLLGGFYMYRLAKQLVGSSTIAVLTSVVYLTTPYNVCLVSYLSYFNEILAMGLLPCIIFYSWRCYAEPNKSFFVLLTGFLWYLLITVHLITYLFFSIFLMGLFLLLAKAEKKYRPLLPVVCAYGLGCLLAIWYLAPLVFIEKYLNVRRSFGGVLSSFNEVSPRFLDLISLRSNFHVPFYNGNRMILASVQPAVGFVILLAISMGIYFIGKKLFSSREQLPVSFIPLFILAVITLFMVWSPINFWAYLPKAFQVIEMTQRLLLQLSWMGSLLFAMGMYWFFKDKFTFSSLIVGIILVLVSTSPWYFGPILQLTKVSDIVKHPYLDQRRNAYLIYPLRYPSLAGIDNMDVEFFFPKGVLQLNHPYSIPTVLWKSAFKPNLVLLGNVSKKQAQLFQSVRVMLNHHLLVSYPLKSGRFRWVISLPLSKEKPAEKEPLVFVSDVQNNKQLDEIALEEELIEGYLDPSTLLSVKQIQPACVQDSKETICKLYVSSKQKWLELPVIYYPDMLDVTVNGKVVPYVSMMNEYRLLTAIVPLAGQMNNIQVRFRGLAWANEISCFSWILWGVACVWLVLKKVMSKRWACKVSAKLGEIG